VDRPDGPATCPADEWQEWERARPTPVSSALFFKSAVLISRIKTMNIASYAAHDLSCSIATGRFVAPRTGSERSALAVSAIWYYAARYRYRRRNTIRMPPAGITGFTL